MAISCVYCGGAHERADEVRACWARSNGQEVVAADAAPHTRAAPAEVASALAPRAPAGVARDRRQAAHPRPSATAWAGPDVLGRPLVLAPGQHAPSPWAGADRIVVDRTTLAAPEATVTTLRDAHLARRRVVVELAVDLTEPPPSVDDRPLHLIGPLGDLPLDELHHLVWSGSVVLGTDGSATYPPADGAVALGAAPLDGEAEWVGDVRLPDGSPAWIDGGRLRWSAPIDGVPVVPLVSVEHGSLRPFGSNDSSAALAPDQLAAVTHPSGVARIIAPAGSGKTRVLTERARHLVRNWGLPPTSLSLVAYNRRAQVEMQERLADVPGLQVRTLNSIALAIINGVAPFAPQPRRLSTITEHEVRRILGDFVQAPRRRSVDPLAPWLAAMSTARLGLLAAEDVEAIDGGDVTGLADVLARYEAALRSAGSVDFDGQIVEAIRLLLRDPAARRAAQLACRVLLADEFQDLTPAHVLLLRLLSAPARDVFGVGDDDQTIYGYNGADPRWLLEYATLFPGAAQHPLEVNYRCPADVVEQVDRLLRRNLRRVPKTIRAGRSGTSGMETVTDGDPVAATVRTAQAALAGGARPADVAVLARVNATLVPVQVRLQIAGTPVRKVAGAEFLERTSIRSALAWIRLASGSAEALAGDDLAEALRRPSRSLSPRLAGWVAEQRSLQGLARLAARLESAKDSEKVLAFGEDLASARRTAAHGTTAELVDLLCDDIGLAGTLATLDLNRRGMNATSQSDDLLALRQLAALHESPATFPTWLATQLRTPGSDSGITLATVHRVKGQEWPHVVVHLADADQFPHRLADDVAEERRLFHVAVTRTSQRVTVVSGPAPSPFVAQLTTEPTDDELRPDTPATPAHRRGQPTATAATTTATTTAMTTVTTRTSRPAAAAPKEIAPRGPLTSGQVLAGAGLVLVDQGQEWVITGVAADDVGSVTATRGEATRRFRFGAKVATAGKQRGQLAPAGPDLPAAAPAVFDQLRQLRERLRHGKPAYTVFDDATLERIALALPRSLGELARVRGVGPAKLEQYGDGVVGLIDEAADALG